MKKLLLVSLMFTKVYSLDYDVVLFGEDQQGYCFAKVKLDDLKKLPDINECTQIFRLLDNHQILKVIRCSDYSSLLKREDNLYQWDLDSEKPGNCYFEMREKLSPHDKHWPFITRRVYRLGGWLCTLYYKYLYFGDDKEAEEKLNQQMIKQLADIIGIQNNTYLFKANDKQIVFKCVCLITEYDLYDAILTYLEDHCKTI